MLRNTLNTFITATLIMLLGVSSSASAQTIVPMGNLMGSSSVTWGNDNQETTESSALRVDLVPAEPRIKQVTTDAIADFERGVEGLKIIYTGSKLDEPGLRIIRNDTENIGFNITTDNTLEIKIKRQEYTRVGEIITAWNQWRGDRQNFQINLGDEGNNSYIPNELETTQTLTLLPIYKQSPGIPVTVTYTITSRANGPDDYALAINYEDDVPSPNITTQPTTEILGPDRLPSTYVNLGATAATGPTDKDSRTITVICDENYPSNSEISCNGIDALDTVIIGVGLPAFTVATGGVSNTGDGPSTIRLDDGVALPSIVVGTRIAEQKTFEVVVSGVALRDPAESGTVSLVVTGTSTDGNQGRASLAFDVTANPIPRSVDRYVRNLTDLTDNPAATDVESTEFDSGGDLGLVNYYKTGVSAEEGDEVEILIAINAGNLEDQTDIMLTDTLSPFVEYIEGTSKLTSPGACATGCQYALIGRASTGSTTHGHRIITQNAFSVLKNTSAHLTYKVTVIGGDEQVAFPKGTAWQVVVDEGETENPDLNACWCDAKDHPADTRQYCKAEGWVVGEVDMMGTESASLDALKTLANMGGSGPTGEEGEWAVCR